MWSARHRHPALNSFWAKGAPRRALSVIRFTWQHPANRGRRVRRVLTVTRFQVLGRMLGRRALTPVGTRSVIVADTRVYHAARAVCGNPLDWNEMSVWGAALGPGSLFVDAGANVGLYTIWALDTGAHVLAAEPSRISRERLVTNLRLNGYHAEVLPVALGETRGTLNLTTALDNQNHLVLSAPPADTPTELVPVQTLDSLVGDRVVDGLKVDVEGAELLVLKGARDLLSTRRIKLIQLEWNEKSVELLGEDRASTAAFLAKYGYELFRPDPHGTLVPLESLDFGPDVFAKPREADDGVNLPDENSIRP